MDKLYSLNILKEIAGGDDAFVKDMVVTFIDSVSAETENMQRLMEIGEWKAIGAIAHKLAPNYAYMDSQALFELAASVEKEIKAGGNLNEIAAMTNRMCAGSLVLIDELRKIL
ncbi:MAG: Hpt domain-containing protein [Bacteroidales bacterium]|nr:Hpt domain-containing protein [Bacteroidales bacterium]